jgi:tRNA pseudouridine38-40 synthase
MREAAGGLLGEHDFSAFRAAGCTARTANRRLTELAIERAGDLVHSHVTGNAFLRNMVRILAGTLVEVGQGRMRPGQVLEILESRQRPLAGPTAPAKGLTLVRVFYADAWPEPRPEGVSREIARR